MWVGGVAIVVLIVLIVIASQPNPIEGSGLVAELNGRRENVHLQVEAGCPMEITVTGLNGFDPVAELQPPSGMLIYDDDGGPGLDSFIALDSPECGVYELVVTGFGGSSGASLVYVWRDPFCS